MATKLKNMRLTSVDLVRNGANQEADICLFKSTDPEEDPVQPTAEEKNIFKRFINWLREASADEHQEGEGAVEKDYTTFDSLTAARENNEKLWQYTNALTESIRSIQMDQDLDKDQKYQLMVQSLDQFDEAMDELIEALCEAAPTGGLAKSETEEEEDEWEWDEEPEDDEGMVEPSELGKSADIDEIEEVEPVQKFNPNHGSDGRFASAGGGGAAGGASASFLDDGDDDELLPWNGSGTAASNNSKKPENPTNDEIKSSLKDLDKHKNLKVYVHEMPDENHTIRAELIGTLPGGKEITFHDGAKITTAAGLSRFKEIYAESAEKIDHYHKTGYRGL